MKPVWPEEQRAAIEKFVRTRGDALGIRVTVECNPHDMTWRLTARSPVRVVVEIDEETLLHRDAAEILEDVFENLQLELHGAERAHIALFHEREGGR